MPRTTYYAVKEYGHFDNPNPEKRNAMEDVTLCIDRYMDDDTKAFFAVYDGHGGRDVAVHAGDNLHKLLATYLQEEAQRAKVPVSKLPQETVTNCITKAVKTTDEQINTKSFGRFQGCTACFCYLDSTPIEGAPRGRIWFVSVGDSRAVLVSRDSDRRILGTRMTRDHKPTDQDETKRVMAAGGFITNGRILGIIAVSRSLGDHCMKPYISNDPFISVHTISPEDRCFMIACDGVWDVIDDQLAANIVGSVIENGQSAYFAARALVDKAIELDTNDNVSALAVILKPIAPL